MEIRIQKALPEDIGDCISALAHSEIGAAYFSDAGKTRLQLTAAVQKGQVFVAVGAREESVGFIWYMPEGVFGSYPYLHLLAVRQEYRGCGIGKQLLRYFEENASDYPSTKCFLTVDDFNPRARKFYERQGYRQVGTLPDFYKKGVSCFLMMKEITR